MMITVTGDVKQSDIDYLRKVGYHVAIFKNNLSDWPQVMAICCEWGVPPDVVTGRQRFKSAVMCRHMCAKSLVENYGLNDADAGDILKRDRTTVIHSLETINNLIETDKKVREIWERVK